MEEILHQLRLVVYRFFLQGFGNILFYQQILLQAHIHFTRRRLVRSSPEAKSRWDLESAMNTVDGAEIPRPSTMHDFSFEPRKKAHQFLWDVGQ